MKGRNATIKIAYVALMSALLTGGKFAMSSLPNIEPVTILLLSFSAVFGAQMGLTTALIFCTVEMSIYGFGSWIIGYYIYWSLLAIVSGLVLRKHQKLWIAIIIAVVGTFLYGVIDAFIYTIFVKVSAPDMPFFKVFAIYYGHGISFILIHLASSFGMTLILFKPLTKLLNHVYISSGLDTDKNAENLLNNNNN